MVTHTQERFRSIMNALNTAFAGTMTFQLVGSLAEKPASFHDADIVVYPTLPVNDATIQAFARGCTKAGNQVMAIDKDYKGPFPGRPNGQWRV
ncbi:MAG: hypothetical protein WA213_20630, partial [Terriglobales bacterium]